MQQWVERAKARVRAKVEHPFRVIKQRFGFWKTRLRGLARNHSKVTTFAALTNLFLGRRSCWPWDHRSSVATHGSATCPQAQSGQPKGNIQCFATHNTPLGRK